MLLAVLSQVSEIFTIVIKFESEKLTLFFTSLTNVDIVLFLGVSQFFFRSLERTIWPGSVIEKPQTYGSTGIRIWLFLKKTLSLRS